MNGDVRELARSIDPVTLGQRLKRARQRAGLTQAELADGEVSTAYVSRIEAGQRRPGADIVMRLAERLDCDVMELLAVDPAASSAPSDAVAALRLSHDYAELHLNTGDAAAALDLATQTLGEAETVGAPLLLRWQLRLTAALAHEAEGRLAEASSALERLSKEPLDTVTLVRVLTALARCYRESGDLAHAVEIGERAAERLSTAELDGTTDGVRLSLTVASAYFERGDVARAVSIASRSVQHAEALDSPETRAAAYWNTSMFESRSGNTDAALVLAEQALAIFESSDDARNLARLRTQLGIMKLRLDPPTPADALGDLTRSHDEMRFASVSNADVADNLLAQARALMLLDDLDAAEVKVAECLALSGGEVAVLEVEGRVLSGQIAAARGQRESALRTIRDAAALLEVIEASRGAAQLWFEIATTFEDLEEPADALSAYRNAAASTGMTRASSTRSRSRA